MTGWHYSKAKIVIVGHSVKKRRVRKQLGIEHRFGRDKDCNRDRDYRQRLAKSTHVWTPPPWISDKNCEISETAILHSYAAVLRVPLSVAVDQQEVCTLKPLPLAAIHIMINNMEASSTQKYRHTYNMSYNSIYTQDMSPHIHYKDGTHLQPFKYCSIHVLLFF